MVIRALKTVDEVIEVLGGPTKVAELTDRSPQQISNAKRNRRLPPATVLVMLDALTAAGCTASPKLWGVEPVRRR